LRIGRHLKNDFVLNDRAGEDFHCEIFLIDGIYWIQDKQTRYGTLVNGKRIEKVQLNPGDELQIGFTRINWEELLGIERPLEIITETNAGDENTSNMFIPANELPNGAHLDHEIVNPVKLNDVGNFDNMSSPAAAHYKINPYAENMAPELANQAFQHVEIIEIDVPAALDNPDKNKEVSQEITPEKEVTAPQKISPTKKRRNLNQDERLLLITLGIMTVMMFIGLLIGYTQLS
jgi:pSer/pThr/pTyr-binding forkhead associated (FHA) protein